MHMKKLSSLTGVLVGVAIACCFAGCETMSSNNAAIAASQKQMLLTQAGFKAKTLTTPKQQEMAAKLATNSVSAVKYNGKLYYVFPTGTTNQVLVGRQPQFDAYKKMLATQQAKTQQTQANRQAEIQAEARQDMYSPERTGETAGPDRVSVEVFDGTAPPLWDPEG